KEPRKVLEQRVPSEIDKRMAAVAEAYQALYTVQEVNPKSGSALGRAQYDLRSAEDRFGPNHRVYLATLKYIRTEPKPIKVPEILMKGGTPELDPPLIGVPKFGKDAPLIQNSTATYKDQLKKIHDEINGVAKQIGELTAKEKEQILRLLGDPDGKLPKVGLYELREIERKRLDSIKAEIQYLKPKVQETRSEAAGYIERRAALEDKLESYKKE